MVAHSKAAPPAPPAARGTVRPREVEAMSEETATQEKRKILRSYDLAPAQFFNANGCSFVQRAALQDVWSIVCQGNEVAAYFSELASDSPKRKQVHLSRLAESILAVHKEFGAAHYEQMLEKKFKQAVDKELGELVPHCKVLYTKETIGDGASAKVTAGTLNYQQRQDVTPGKRVEPAAVEAAAKHIYQWSRKSNSPLRTLLFGMSGGGVFYVASVYDKVTRAYIQEAGKEGQPVPVSDFVAMSKARLCPEQTAEVPAAISEISFQF